MAKIVGMLSAIVSFFIIRVSCFYSSHYSCRSASRARRVEPCPAIQTHAAP